MNIEKTTKFIFVLAITTLIIGLSGCERMQEMLEPPMPQRDHVWVVDQNGVEVPVPGTWMLMSKTHPDSVFTVGESFVLPADPQHKAQTSEGTYTDSEGTLWTKVKITTADDIQLQFLERVDTSVSPNQLHLIFTVDDNGANTPNYAQYPFDSPNYDVQIWEKQ